METSTALYIFVKVWNLTFFNGLGLDIMTLGTHPSDSLSGFEQCKAVKCASKITPK
jgi:hypothetical protein